ncbi:MAG: hypothetical protein H7146_08450 [Burkholderiaceae bacterium]|nr:hypothetical protein [Microbacteriaceae bacterium]
MSSALAPVLLLPGVYKTWEFLTPLADALSRLGHPLTLRRALREFALRSAAIAALARDTGANSRIVSINEEDDAVIPGNGLRDGAVNLRLPLVGHFRPLAAPLPIRTVVDAVRDDPAHSDPSHSDPPHRDPAARDLAQGNPVDMAS